MVTQEQLPPACAFAVSVLAERDQDPDAVPEEAVEAAQLHMISCERCRAASHPPANETRKKKRARRGIGSISAPDENTLSSPEQGMQQAEEGTPPQGERLLPALPAAMASLDGVIDCQQCRQSLLEYAQALDSGLNVAELYPAIQLHLQVCESGCLVLFALCQQEAKATRKYRRSLVRNPFKIISWEVTGFFHGGQIPVTPRALAFGTLLLLIIFASLTTFVGINIHEARYHPTPSINLPTPDGVGISDGLHIYDACNGDSYTYKQQATTALQIADMGKADSLLKSATNATLSDTNGCNGAEAAIYREDLQVRQTKHPFNIVMVSFDSGSGIADPQGGTDRKTLYAASTQELIGAFIAQQQYNTAQMKIAGAPLLYLVLANTTGTEQGAWQVATIAASLAQTKNIQKPDLLVKGAHPLLGVLGLGPSNLAQVALSTLCRAGVPMISPTSMGQFLVDLQAQSALYSHCTAGFAFVRLSSDIASQAGSGAAFAYSHLGARSAAVIYNPSDPASQTATQNFQDTFSRNRGASIVARETTNELLDANNQTQAARVDLLAALNDALQTHPGVIFASLHNDDATTLIQAIARLPQDQQPALILGGDAAQPRALLGLVQWARQQKLSWPQVFVVQAAMAHPPTDDEWQKQFYATFCTSFARTGTNCSGEVALDQGALYFADSINLITTALNALPTDNKTPFTRADLIQKLAGVSFTGVSGPIALQAQGSIIINNNGKGPVVVSIQQDGTLQMVG